MSDEIQNPGLEPRPEAPAEPAREDAARDAFEATVARKQRRKLRARSEKRRGLAFGLGLFGLIGWSVAVPTLIGIALGVWIDRGVPSRYSWTLMLLVAGIAVGCLNAWYWLRREGGFDDR